ncbi:MAG: methyltransferase domain-containing protein [Patescibacteria group bacterium]
MEKPMKADQEEAADFLKEWKDISSKDVFERRLFLEDFGGIWNKIWNKDALPRDIFAHRLFMRTYSTFDRFIPNDYHGSILAIGAGTGKAGIKLARNLPQSSVTVASNDSKSVEVIKVILSEFGLANATAAKETPENLSFPDNSFNMVLVDAIEGSFSDYDKALAEAVRVLKPGGQLIIVGLNRSHLMYSIYSRLAGVGFIYDYEKSFGKGELVRGLRTLGLSVSVAQGFDPGYGSYAMDTTPASLRALGRFADKLVRIANKLFFGAIVDSFGLGLFVMAEKPADKKAMELAAMAEITEQVRKPLPSDKELKRVEIIVLKYKDPEVEWRAAKHLLENTEWPYKMNFFDNRPGTKNMAKACNKLIRESTCEYVLIMDSDVFVPKLAPCWLTRLMSNFLKEDCYVSLPKVTVTSCAEQKAQKPENKPAYEIRARFAGMCVLYKKEIFEKVGYFDEEFLLRGSDVEWVDRLFKSPYKAYISPDVLVDHVGSYSSKKSDKKAEFSRALERIYANTLYNKKRS